MGSFEEILYKNSNGGAFDIFSEFYDNDGVFNTSRFRNGTNGLPRNIYDIDPSFVPEDFNYICSFRQPSERTYYQKVKAQRKKIDTDGGGYIDQIIEWEEINPKN